MFKLIFLTILLTTAFTQEINRRQKRKPLQSPILAALIGSGGFGGGGGSSRGSAESTRHVTSNQNSVAILHQTKNIEPDGSYEWAYELDNGISAQERASIRLLGPDQAEKAAQGSFSWTSPEGEKILMSYVADENGYQPTGSHLPVAPPVPPQIQRALEWIAAHPQP